MQPYRSIKELVIDLYNSEGAMPSYSKVTALVHQHFPQHRWQESHYYWYISQINNGRLAVKNRKKPSKPRAVDVEKVDSPITQARLIMEAVAVLHARGYGRLKLLCYFKEGLGAWRHGLLAADNFPRHVHNLRVGSLPGWPLATGQTAEEVADAIIAKAPELLESALGTDGVYVSWYKGILAQYPKGILQMESSDEAMIAGVQIPHPLGSV